VASVADQGCRVHGGAAQSADVVVTPHGGIRAHEDDPEAGMPAGASTTVGRMPASVARVTRYVPWLLVVPGAIWACVRVLGVETGSLPVQLMSFTPYAAAASVVPLLVAVAMRRRWMGVVAALVCVTLALCILPRSVGFASTVDGVPLVIMSTNIRVGGADAARLVDLARTQRVDVLTVQELTPQAATNLARLGLTSLLPYHESHPVEGVDGSAVYSRYPLTDGGMKVNPGGFRQAYALVRISGAAPVAVESAHPVPPLDAQSIRAWTRDLRSQTPARADGRRRILAGDFNATLDHAELRGLTGMGYRDAAAQVGAGLTPTWPYYGIRAAVTPKATIDHILVDEGIGVRDFAAFTVPLTDHRAILATLTVPRA
jgi:endonuclease/exonuclease/phosphatase family metal-dependent hydrolase